jgi:hypothetical protein
MAHLDVKPNTIPKPGRGPRSFCQAASLLPYARSRLTVGKAATSIPVPLLTSRQHRGVQSQSNYTIITEYLNISPLVYRGIVTEAPKKCYRSANRIPNVRASRIPQGQPWGFLFLLISLNNPPKASDLTLAGLRPGVSSSCCRLTVHGALV